MEFRLIYDGPLKAAAGVDEKHHIWYSAEMAILPDPLNRKIKSKLICNNK